MQTGMKLAPGEIPASLMDGILLLLKETRYGQIVLVAQDRRLIQVERREKIRVKEGQLARIACRISEQAFPELASASARRSASSITGSWCSWSRTATSCRWSAR